jgi:Cu/Ag efflux protein CusF
MRRRALWTLCLFAPGCSRQAKEAEPTHAYRVRGEVVRLTPEGRRAVIRHEAIRDEEGVYWSSESTMEFTVKDAAEFSPLRVGQRIQGQMVQRLDTLDYWLEQIEITAGPPLKAP